MPFGFALYYMIFLSISYLFGIQSQHFWKQKNELDNIYILLDVLIIKITGYLTCQIIGFI